MKQPRRFSVSPPATTQVRVAPADGGLVPARLVQWQLEPAGEDHIVRPPLLTVEEAGGEMAPTAEACYLQMSQSGKLVVDNMLQMMQPVDYFTVFLIRRWCVGGWTLKCFSCCLEKKKKRYKRFNFSCAKQPTVTLLPVSRELS